MRRGILLDGNDELGMRVKKDRVGLITAGLVVQASELQDAYLALSLNQGELKEDPIVGANLLKMIRAKERPEKIRKTIEISLRRVDVKVDDIKNLMELIINKQTI